MCVASFSFFFSFFFFSHTIDGERLGVDVVISPTWWFGDMYDYVRSVDNMFVNYEMT